MALDLYKPKSKPAPVPVSPRSGPSGWLGGLLLVAGPAVLLCTLLLGRGSRDDNPPDVDPVPGAKGLHVLIVEETGDRENLPASQIPIFSSIELREWYEANCAKEGDQPAYRCFDKDDKLDRETPIWRELREKLDIEPPAFIAVNGRRAAKGKLPQDVDAWKAQLEKLNAAK